MHLRGESHNQGACAWRHAQLRIESRREVLLGRRNDPLLEVLARQLIERLAVAKCQKDLTLWVGLLRSDDPESIKGVIEAVCAKSRVFGGGDRSNE